MRSLSIADSVSPNPRRGKTDSVGQFVLHEAEVVGTEVADGGQHSGQVGCADAKPLREGGCILRAGCGWNPPAVGAGIVWAGERERRIGAVDLPALDGTTENDVVRAPRMVAAAVRVGLEGATEIGHGEAGDIAGDAEFNCCVVECGE